MEITNIQDKVQFLDGSFTKRVIYQDENIVSFVLNFKPGQELPYRALSGSTVVIDVHSGTGEIVGERRVIPITAGDIISVKGNENLGVRNTGSDSMTLYVNMAPRPSDTRYSQDIG